MGGWESEFGEWMVKWVSKLVNEYTPAANNTPGEPFNEIEYEILKLEENFVNKLIQIFPWYFPFFTFAYFPNFLVPFLFLSTAL